MKAGNVHVYMWLHIALIKSTVENKTSFFPSPFNVSTSSHLTLAGAFHNDCVAACSSCLCSASEDKEAGGYVTVPCPSKETQNSFGVLAPFIYCMLQKIRKFSSWSLVEQRKKFMVSNHSWLPAIDK